MEQPIGPNPCAHCGGEYGEHRESCPQLSWKDGIPRRFKIAVEKHPTRPEAKWFYGCYFPQTDLCISEMARPGTGIPTGVEWLD